MDLLKRKEERKGTERVHNSDSIICIDA